MAVTITVSGTTATIDNDVVIADDLTVNGDAVVTGTTTLTGAATANTFASSGATITGGTITGITDLAIADGGTGASTATAARTALDVPSTSEAILDTIIDAKGDLIVGTASDTPARLAVGTDGYAFSAESGTTSGLIYLPRMSIGDIVNGAIIESHAANAVTYTLKDRSESDLSATNPCYLVFPSSTLTNSGFTIVKITANISVTVSSGSTLGHGDAIAQHTFVYAINNAGTAELAVSNLPPDYPGTFSGQRLISTTAEGGAGAADSATGIYSTTARSSVPWIPLAKVKGTQTTAGTWAANPTQLDIAPFSIPRCAFSASPAAATSLTQNTDIKVTNATEEFDGDAVYDATNSKYQPNIAGIYRFGGGLDLATTAATLTLKAFKNGSNAKSMSVSTVVATTNANTGSAIISMNGTTDYLELYAFQSSATQNNNTASTAGYIQGERVSG